MPHCHDWDGHSGRDSHIASPCRYPGRDLTGTLAVGQDVANLLAKHLLQDVRIPICNSGKLVWDLQGSRPYADLCTAARSEKRGLTGTPLLDKAKVTVKHLPEHLQLQRSKLESLLLGCQVRIRMPGAQDKDPKANLWKDKHLRVGHEEYQQTAEACSHPLAPCKRVLVDARMGDGKGKVLIATVGQQFADGCKKLPIFPTKAQA